MKNYVQPLAFKDLNYDEKRNIRHEMAKQLQKEIFIIAFDDWLQANHHRPLTDEERVSLQTQFKVYDDFKDIYVKKPKDWVEHTRLLDQFISCDAWVYTPRFVHGENCGLIWYGFDPRDITLPLATNKSNEVYVNSREEGIWQALLIGDNYKEIQKVINERAQLELDRYEEFLDNVYETIDNDIKSSTDAKEAEDKIDEYINKYFNSGDFYITSTHIDSDIRCKFVFHSYKEAIGCIEFIENIISDDIDTNGIKWFTNYYGSGRIIYMYDVITEYAESELERKYPNYERHRWLFQPYKPNQETQTVTVQ